MSKYHLYKNIYLFKFVLYAYFIITLVVKYKESTKQLLEFKELYFYKSNLI